MDVQVLLQLALDEQAIHVKTSQPITAENIHTSLPIFQALSPGHYVDTFSLSDPSYESNQWCSLSKARSNFDPDLGGPEGFDRWIMSAMTIHPTEAYKTHNSVAQVLTQGLPCIVID